MRFRDETETIINKDMIIGAQLDNGTGAFGYIIALHLKNGAQINMKYSNNNERLKMNYQEDRKIIIELLSKKSGE